MKFDVSYVRAVIYDGTIESYNLLASHLWDGENMHIWFLDENGDITPIFTGTVVCAKTGVKYRPGDTYIVDVKNEDNSTDEMD